MAEPIDSGPLARAVEHIEMIAETPTVRVSLLTLAPGQSLPWHHHSEVRDSFVCVTGRLRLEARDPDERSELGPGETARVRAGRSHKVSAEGGETCRYLLVQDGGAYDFRTDDG